MLTLHICTIARLSTMAFTLQNSNEGPPSSKRRHRDSVSGRKSLIRRRDCKRGWHYSPQDTSLLKDISFKFLRETSCESPTGCSNQSQLSDAFFTMRLEHRQVGNGVHGIGEERFLLFRSDQHGAIGKVVFSCAHEDGENTPKAKLHVLYIKREYRGNGLGTLLFECAMDSLVNQYSYLNCFLDVEEDIQRHNRLLSFYEQLGCELRQDSKVLYLNNNDAELYRKIPMMIRLNSDNWICRNFSGTSFLPIMLLNSNGQRAEMDTQREVLDLLIFDVEDDRIQFRTTSGQYLKVINDNGFRGGSLTITNHEDADCFFHLYQISRDCSSSKVYHCDDDARSLHLWILQSTSGFFLTIECHSLCCSNFPSYWQPNKRNCTLTCTTNFCPELH